MCSDTLLQKELLKFLLLSALVKSLFFRFPRISSDLKSRLFDGRRNCSLHAFLSLIKRLHDEWILRWSAAELQDAHCAGGRVMVHHCDGRIGWIGRPNQSTKERLK